MRTHRLPFLLGFLVSASACSNNALTRDAATALVSSLPVETVQGTVTINMSYASDFQDNIEKFRAENAPFVGRGILTAPEVTESPSTDFTNRKVATIRVALTDSARALVLGEKTFEYRDARQFSVKCGELRFADVVGVFQEGNAKTATIEYRVTFVPTMFATFATMQPQVDRGAIVTRRVTAKKYDSGWRIES